MYLIYNLSLFIYYTDEFLQIEASRKSVYDNALFSVIRALHGAKSALWFHIVSLSKCFSGLSPELEGMV